MGDYQITNENVGFSEDALVELRENEAVKSVAVIQFSLYEQNEAGQLDGIDIGFPLKPGETFQVVGLNDEYWDYFISSELSADQLEQLKSGNACVVRNPIPVSYGDGQLEFTSIEAGSTINVAGTDLEVLKTLDGYDGYLGIGNGGFTNGVQVIVDDSIYEQLTGKNTYSEFLPTLNAGADRENFDTFIEDFCEQTPGTTFLSYEETDQQLQESFAQIQMLAWGLILFVGLIGILNIINTVYTNIHTRVTEIGMQRAIGMSAASLYKTFLWEGAYLNMKRKARIQTGIDDRLVAIYARKSRITNKGDSIGVQFKQSADYAINQLSLPEDYEFTRYEDKGLSGYYSDRPDFQRLLRDIEMGKIKAVACYKLDRISRKTSDLMRLLEYFERHDVTLLVCSNNINTRISTSKIIIQVLAIIAEFERDILTERIQDNLMELAKDGRWLGGKTPTGFSSQRVTTGSGKNKSAISFLVPVQEEKEIVLEIYGTFWETRSLLQTANIINEKYETKHGAKFTTSTIRLILRNPIYCVADEYSYNYFLEHDGNLFGEPSDFDGQHGLTAYNKTDQMKVEDEDSTFFNPKFSQLLTRKPISEWIVSVGRHEGFISSRKWVETQSMLDEIAEKYNRPHRKTNALLSGLMYCPICGKRLRVLPESNRWTNGKPRFKYACPGVRAKECTFKGVEGVTLDEFVIHSLSSLQEEHSDYYRQLLENRVASMIRTDQSEKEYQETKKAIERLNADIAAQVRNLREADDALKRFIQDDIKELTDELAKREAALRRMEDTQSENQYLIHELNGMKKRLLSFEEFAKDAQPEALFTLVHSIVDRIYITTDGTKQKCQVYIKGCATEDYSDVLGAAGYIEEEPLLPVVSYMPPMCDLDYYSICAEVSQKNLLQRKPCGNREDIERIMQLETSENSRGGSVSGSYPHAGGNTTQDECFQFRRFSQREKQSDHFRETFQFEVQIWKQAVLVPWILCRYSR